MVRSALLGIIANLFYHLTVVANTNLVVSLTSLVMLRGLEPRISGLKGQRVSQFHYSTINKLNQGNCCHSICPYVLAFGVYPLFTNTSLLNGRGVQLLSKALQAFWGLHPPHYFMQKVEVAIWYMTQPPYLIGFNLFYTWQIDLGLSEWI